MKISTKNGHQSFLGIRGHTVVNLFCLVLSVVSPNDANDSWKVGPSIITKASCAKFDE